MSMSTERIYLFCSYVRVCLQLVIFVREHIWHKTLLMRYSIRLELTRVCSLSDFQLVMRLYRGHHLFFLECVELSLLYASLVWDMFCCCVCDLLSDKPSKICWSVVEKKERIRLRDSPMDSYPWTHQNWPYEQNLRFISSVLTLGAVY